MRKTPLFLAVAGFGFLVLPGCAAQPPIVVPAVVPVQVIDSTVPQDVITHENCRLQGQVLAKTTDRYKPNNLGITAEELNVIKDKAAVLGANSVVIRHNQVVYDKGYYVHVINADAYSCNVPSY
jgi:hypothetical protein